MSAGVIWTISNRRRPTVTRSNRPSSCSVISRTSAVQPTSYSVTGLPASTSHPRRIATTPISRGGARGQRQEVADQAAIALLEDVQRQDEAGKQNRAERKEGEGRRHPSSVSARRARSRSRSKERDEPCPGHQDLGCWARSYCRMDEGRRLAECSPVSICAALVPTGQRSGAFSRGLPSTSTQRSPRRRRSWPTSGSAEQPPSARRRPDSTGLHSTTCVCRRPT